MLTARAYDIHAAQLLARIQQLHATLSAAAISYRIVGGMAVFIHVFERDPIQARLTSDIDVALDQSDLAAVIKAFQNAGMVHRKTNGTDTLVDALQPKARSAIHLVFQNDKLPASPPSITKEGILLAPVHDLVMMKLTSFRLKDIVHIQDLDNVGLISPSIEAQLPDLLRRRLAEIRATE